ncbi:hypothetical protein SESBI_14205 [Sesbania bispinosa]|nr:hypothetical protein SESBI_14205 [Sesbania bispinosa]
MEPQRRRLAACKRRTTAHDVWLQRPTGGTETAMGAAAREKRHSRRGAAVTTAHGGMQAAGRKRAVARGLAFTGRRRDGYKGKSARRRS